MQRAAILVIALATVLAGCSDGNRDGAPRVATGEPDEGSFPDVDPSDPTRIPEPPTYNNSYEKPTREPTSDNARPVIGIEMVARSEFTHAQINYTFLGTDDGEEPLKWQADLDGDGTFEVSGRGMPANVTKEFRIHGPYRVTLQVTDGYHEVESSEDFLVDAYLVRPYIDINGTIREPFVDPANPGVPGYPTCEILGSSDVVNFDVESKAWTAPWTLAFNYTVPFDGVFVDWFNAAGNDIGGGSSNSDSGILTGTIPRETVSGRISACADSVTFHFWAFSQGWCRPASENCQDIVGDDYSGEPTPP